MSGLLRRVLEFFRISTEDLGRRGEAIAARHLRRQGLRIVARNFRSKSGEIDIVAVDRDTLVFVEVKSAVSSGKGDPLMKIDPAKIRRILRTAALFRRRAGSGFESWRVDGVVVDFERNRRGRPVPAGVRWYPDLSTRDTR
jgi:putative endonuclease